jgi:hypothetical protein
MIKKGYLASILLGFCSNLLLAQGRVPAWGGGADQDDIAFGFSFGYVSSYYKIVKKPDWRTPFFDQQSGTYITEPLNSISSQSLPGFAIGFITRYRLSEHLELRSNPALIFADRQLYYTYPTAANDVTKQVQSTSVDFPLSLKLKSDRIGDIRAYILGGIKYTAAVGGKKDDSNLDPLDRLVKNNSGFGSYEAGLGCDIYFEFFKLSPELKISNSLGNVLTPENQPYSSPISKLGVHTVTFSLVFE